MRDRPLATKALLGLALAKLLLHLATHHRYGYQRDELYFIACGERLAWGYVDHPPLVPALARLAGALFGHSLLGLRLGPVLALTAALVLTGLIARRLGGGPFAQALAALSFLVAPLYLRFGTFLNIPSFEVLIWCALTYLLVRLLRGGDRRLWLAVGLVAGVGLLLKHALLLFGFSLAIGLLATRARQHLADRWIWLGGALAIAVVAPNLLWQIAHGFPTLEFLENLNRDVMSQVSAAEFLLGQVLYMHPLLLPVWLAGLCWYLFARDAEPFRPLGWMFVVMVVVLLAVGSKVYYLAPAFPMLLAAGAVAIEAGLAATRLRWARAAIPALLVAGGGAFLPVALPILPIDTLDAVIPRATLGLVDDPYALTEHFHKEFGWENQARVVARVYEGLPEPDRPRTAILAGNYGEAGAIDFFGAALGLPRAISGHHSYYMWGPGNASGEVVIALGVDRPTLDEIFGHVVEVARIHDERALPIENDLPVYVCREPRQSLREAWPRLRRYVRIN